MVQIKTEEGFCTAKVSGSESDIFADCARLVVDSFKIVRSLNSDNYDKLKLIFLEAILSDKMDEFTRMKENDKMFGVSYNPADLEEGEAEDENI